MIQFFGHCPLNAASARDGHNSACFMRSHPSHPARRGACFLAPSPLPFLPSPQLAWTVVWAGPSYLGWCLGRQMGLGPTVPPGRGDQGMGGGGCFAGVHFFSPDLTLGLVPGLLALSLWARGPVCRARTAGRGAVALAGVGRGKV